MEIHLIHGVIEGWHPSRRLHRLYVPKDQFVSHLRHRAKRYCRLTAKSGSGGVLTVDDSTRAGAEACFIARELGHHVIFYLNPYQIIMQEPYFFSVLDASLDQLALGQRCLHPIDALTQLRKETRSKLMVQGEESLKTALAEFAAKFEVASVELPAEVMPINRAILKDLVTAGVEIGNHGWAHVEISALSSSEAIADISRSSAWLESETNQTIASYAVPYGLTIPSEYILRGINQPCLLVNSDLPVGCVGANLWNRLDITPNLQKIR